jgi:soluble lytic murein transglycosylase
VRAEFQKAYAGATAESLQKQTDSEALRSYVLYPYLQQKRTQLALAANDGNGPIVDQAAEDFLKAHGVEPAVRELRRVWYASLAKREEWERYLANYREVDDPALRCHALTARIKLERFDGLAPMVVQLWSTASGSLPACEIAFTWLKTQTAWTPALIEKRARAALSADNPSFARQMIALLPTEMKPPLENWAALIERPLAAIDAAIANPSKEIEAGALLDGWTRLARGNPDAAMQRYDSLVRTRKLDAATASRFALELALPLSWNRRSEAPIYFAKVRPTELDERGWEWYGRAAIWNGDWKLTAKVIGAMPDTLRRQTRWRYWLARVTELRGDGASARTQYAALLHDDNYYAALAAARLNKPYTPEQRSIEPNEAQLQAIAQEPPFQRARELQLTDLQGLRDSAYDEWRFGYNKLNAEARAQAVVLAERWAWHDQAILIAAEQRLFSDYQLLYPRTFDEEVDAAAKLTGLSPAIIYSTLRQESIFRIDAMSSAGARGLMQVLPDSAKQTARRWKLPSPENLFDPGINISIGAAHLKDISNRFDGKLALALAGYNSGPNTVVRWLPAKPKEVDVWIENIPFNETRTYVQRVLWHSIIFGWLASNNAQDATGWLTTVSAPQK